MKRLFVALCLVTALIAGGWAHGGAHAAVPDAKTIVHAGGPATAPACCAVPDGAAKAAVSTCSGDTILADLSVREPDIGQASRLPGARFGMPRSVTPDQPLQPPDRHT